MVEFREITKGLRGRECRESVLEAYIARGGKPHLWNAAQARIMCEALTYTEDAMELSRRWCHRWTEDRVFIRAIRRRLEVWVHP